MSTLTVDFDDVLSNSVVQIRYALAFLSEDVISYDIDESERKIRITFRQGADADQIRSRVDQLLQRYSTTAFGMKAVVALDQRRALPLVDAWAGMVERRWATPVGDGHVILRGPAAQLLALVDHKVQTMFVNEFRAELEIFPSTIKSETLDRCKHFTSFPEHMDFVAHLKQDLDVLSDFAKRCREEGWSSNLHEGKMSTHDFAVSPSCCYHAYEGMEGWKLDKPGRAITAILHCHRYEAANHKYLSRLRAFTMREVIWVGQPSWVIRCRARADELIQQWAKEWELSCTYETANDMFFTDDFAVKASFQRQQQAKRELRMEIPSEQSSISIFSSNFHATTFGKAFDITVDGRTAASACVAWGCERWVHSLISQFGFDVAKWSPGLKRDYEQFIAGGRAIDHD